MWLESPAKTLIVAGAAVALGALVIIVGLSTLNAVFG
ncbi:MAG: hypothetical protein ACI9ON_002238 [Limisphaerales bacterium]|jgi:hypothetical protein